MLASLSDDVYSKTNDVSADSGSFKFDYSVDNPNSGFKANVYRNGSQVVIAVRGTDTKGEALVKNLLADTAFAETGPISDLLVQYSKELAVLVKNVTKSGETITLTGHSLGGAVAQMVGNVANLNVQSFDAPGAAYALVRNVSQNTSLATLLSDIVPRSSGTTSITNYRMAGDQVSLIGVGQIGKTVTVPDGSCIFHGFDGTCLTSVNLNVIDYVSHAFASHSIDGLVRSIQKYCSDGTYMQPEVSLLGLDNCTLGQTYETSDKANQMADRLLSVVKTACKPAVVTGIVQVLVDTAALYGSEMRAQQVCEAVSGKVVAKSTYVDPPAGRAYFLQVNSGSPNLSSFTLPMLSGVFGWELQYHDQSGWSPAKTLMGDADFDFLTDVDQLAFVPLDANGNPTYNPDDFYFGFTPASDGDFSAEVVTFGNRDTVPEPQSILLVLLGMVGIVISSRKRQKQKIAKTFH